MRSLRRLSLPRASLFVLFLVDGMASLAFVLNQWFAFDPWPAWALSAVLSVPAALLLWPFIDNLISHPIATRDVMFSGDKIPGAGQ